MRYVEDLRHPREFRRFDLVALQLGNAVLDCIGIFGILVLDNGYRHAVNKEHHIGAVALACQGAESPFPSYME